MYKKTMKKWGLGAITGVLVLGSLTPIIQPYMTVSAAENTIKQLKASGQGTISDVMFEDLNGNSVQDNNETTGVAGIKVELYNDQGTLVSTSTTGTDGRYTFSNVPDGTYYLHVDMSTLPSDEKLYTSQGINGADGNSSYFTIANGNTITGFHFGFYPQQGAIQSFVYNDTNKNGQKDSNESGISGVHIALYNESGTKVADATTDSSGAYSFKAVKPGKYYAKADIPANYKYQSSTYFGADGTTGYFTVASEQTLHNELNLGLSTLNNSAVSGTVTDAATGSGLANTRVELHDVQGNLINAQQTDASGHYNFTGLAAGDYYTKVVIPSDYDFVSSNGFGSDGNSNYIQLNGDNTSSNYTIALKKQVKDNSAVSGTVTDATTGNGLANIRVELHDVQGNLVDAKQTDASGRYNFTGLAAGNYYTKVVIPNNYDFASSNGFGSDGNSNYIQLDGQNTSTNYTIALKKQANTTISGVINTPSGQGVSENVSLYNVDGTLVKTVATNSQGNFSFDGISEGNYYVKASIPEGYTFESSAGFGSDGNSYYLQADGTSNISNLRLTLAQKTGQIRSTVFSDLNKNGTQEAGESGIAGATVTLYSNTGAVVETTTTDANGLYKFETITPGTYYVKVTAPAGYDVLANTAFGDDGVSGYININAEQTRTDMNASLVAKADPTAVANAKWIYHTGFAPSTDLAEGGEISVSNTYKDGYNNDNVDVAFYNSEDKIVDPSSYTTTLSNPDLFSSVKANGTHIAFTHTEKTGSSLVTVKDASGKVVRTFTITITADPTSVANAKWIYHTGFAPSTDLAEGGEISVSNTYKDGYNNDNVDVAFYNSEDKIVDPSSYTTTLSNPDLFSAVKANGTHIAFTHTEKTGSSLVTVKDASGKVVRTFTIT
ncbi:SdrD B-like domain-containing protein, partial [Listeria booriae]